MASTQQTVVFPSTALTATTTGSAVVLVPRTKRCIGYLVVSGQSGTVTVAGKIQHSPDGVNGWTDWLSFTTTSAGAAANEVKLPTSDFVLPYVRAVLTLGGAATTCTAAVYLYSETYAQ